MFSNRKQIERRSIIFMLGVSFLSLVLAFIVSIKTGLYFMQNFMPMYFMLCGFMSCGIFNGINRLILNSIESSETRHVKKMWHVIGMVLSGIIVLFVLVSFISALRGVL